MKIVTSCVAVLVLLMTLANGVVAASIELNPDAEHAALMGDWPVVANLLSDVTPDSPAPVARLLKAHASLALNRSNTSLLLFASALDDDARRQWSAWTQDVVARFPSNANAHYLRGDAFARQRAWDEAKQAFETALDLEPGSFLALNARGVVSHAVGNTLQARVFFQRATSERPDFADAYASRGALNVYQNSSRAVESFAAAARYSKEPDALVSILGSGCVAFGQGDYDSAEGLFSRIPDDSPLSVLARRNYLATQLARFLVLGEQAYAVGTTLEAVEVTTAGNALLFAESEIRIDWSGPRIRIRIGWGGKPKPNDKDKPNPKPASDGGSTATTASVVLPPELLPPIGFPPGIPNPFGPDGFPGRPMPLSSAQLTDVINAVEQATVKASQQVSQAVDARAATTAETEPGGADADSRQVRSSRGPWLVTTVYGLLYAIPLGDVTPTIDGV